MGQIKGLVAVTLCALLLASAVIPLDAGELDEAVKAQERLRQQEQQARGELKQLTYTADKIKNQIKELASQITVAQNNLAQKQQSYSKLQRELAQSELELAEREKDLERRRDSLRRRVRGMYQDGQISYLELLFEARDLGDFITRIEYFNKLVASDQKILTDINEQKESIATKVNELQVRRDEASKLKAEAATAKTELDSKNSQYKAALDSNHKAQNEIFEQIDKLEADSNALTDKIRKMTAKSSGKVHGTVSTYPLPGYTEISSEYGWRTHPITRKKSLHTGVDIPAPSGTQIKAAGAGTVIMAGWYGAYGNTVIVDHGGGYTTLYGHNSGLNVSVGDTVTAGQAVARVGSTGWSTGPHLHFEVRINGNPTDPMRFF